MKRTLYILLILIPFHIVPLLAQSEDGKIMTLKECIEMGLENNYSLRIIRNEDQIAKNNTTLGNAGYLPKINFESGFNGSSNEINQKNKEGGNSSTQPINSTVDVGINLTQSLFEGFSLQTNYQKLKELAKQGELKTRIQIENLVSDITFNYYNYINQKIRMENLLSAVKLSEERVRIVEARYQIRSVSRLELQEAKVALNEDKSNYIQQEEKIFTSIIELNRLMGLNNVSCNTIAADTAISINTLLNFADLQNKMNNNNAELLLSNNAINLSEQDYKLLKSRNYPYLRLNAGYGYKYQDLTTATYDNQQTYGVNYGLSMGITIFDGFNRRREQKNARITIENKKLGKKDVELELNGNLHDIYNAYQNNIRLLSMEKENLITAQDYYETAMERYKIGDLSGIELREAQLSLLSAKERLQSAMYNTKVCEISLFLICGEITEYMK